jgi:hypothetical protein
MSGVLTLAGAGREAGRIATTSKRHTPDQMVPKLGRADRMFADGNDVAAVFCELGVSEQSYYRWQNQYGGMKAEDAKGPRGFEKRNGTLKPLLAGAELERAVSKELAGLSRSACRRPLRCATTADLEPSLPELLARLSEGSSSPGIQSRPPPRPVCGIAGGPSESPILRREGGLRVP